MHACKGGHAFCYIDQLQKEFVQLHGQQIDNVERPYKFITFDTFIQKTKKLYTVSIGKNLRKQKSWVLFLERKKSKKLCTL